MQVGATERKSDFLRCKLHWRRGLLFHLSLGFLFSINAGQMIQTQVDPEQSALISLDSLLNICISTAAKYEQLTEEAAASITSITADEIQQYGYHTLADALTAERSFSCTQHPLMTGVPECVKAGVTLGVDLLGDRPLLRIDLKTDYLEGVNFSVRLSTQAKSIE